MKKTSKTIVFFGNERLATGVSTTAPTLQMLITAGYTVAAVICNNDTARSRRIRTLEIQEIAERHNIPVLFPKKLSDVASELSQLHAAVGILVAYGKMVPQSVIDIFPRGIVNLHPSLLPKHRGPTPIESVILQNEPETGVSIMKLVSAMDAGPIYAQSSLQLRGNETKQQLADLLIELGGTILLDILPAILAGRVQPTEQNSSDVTTDTLITKESGNIDWTQSAERIAREVRAYANWPQSHTQLGGKDVVITRASALSGNGEPGKAVYAKESKSLSIFCGNGKLSIERIKPAGKSEMDIGAFLAGYSTTF